LSPSEQAEHAQSLARQLGALSAFLRARRIGGYVSADGEIDPAPLLGLAWDRHKRVYFPVLRPHPHPRLWFVEHCRGERMVENAFGIPEPARRGRRILLPQALDLLLVPLVGFDEHGNRIGMGGGFYDRSLAYLKDRRHWRRPLLIGLAHECQRVEHLEPNPWDVPLDLVATEVRIYRRPSTQALGPANSR
jgi:5-formyltetrahydrofolate cyclo-ligase